jgi:hypothetical protein
VPQLAGERHPADAPRGFESNHGRGAAPTLPMIRPDTSNDTELEKLKKRLPFVMYCIDCFASWKRKLESHTFGRSSVVSSQYVLAIVLHLLPADAPRGFESARPRGCRWRSKRGAFKCK